MWEYNQTPSPDELYHYGVVGMKWGKRRAAMKGKEYVYTSHSTKKYNKKVAKLSKKKKLNQAQEAKLDIYSKRAKRSAQHDKNMQKLADKTTTGETVAAVGLLGGGNTKGYMQRRAAGMGVARSAAGVAAGSMIGVGGRVGGMLAKRNYITQDENKSGRAARAADKKKRKEDIKNIRKEINAKASTAGRIYNRLTEADKYQAEIMYEQRKKKKR